MHYGIDIGGTKTEFAVFDSSFQRVTSKRIKTQTSDYDKFLSVVRQLVEDADAIYGTGNSIGVGLPGIVNRHGISFSANAPCINGKTVQKDLALLLKRKVECINDVKAFALSEWHGGAADGVPAMVGVILGTGAAGGYCRAGLPLHGADGVAGEWGHLPIAATLVEKHALPLFECKCGAKGCIENYASGPGMVRIYKHLFQEEVDAVECVSRMRRGVESAQTVFGVWIDCVASAIAQIVMHVNPDVIVIGGGLSQIDELYEFLPQQLRTHLLRSLDVPPVRRAVFGDDSGVRGAAIVGAYPAGKA